MVKDLLMFAVVGLCGIAPIAAETLSPEQALVRLSDSNGALRAPTAGETRLVTTRTDAQGDPAIYVFSAPGQTLFVAADDVAVPLLGYAPRGMGSEVSLPPQLQWWLGEYAREIEWAKSSGIVFDKGANAPLRSFTDQGPIAPMVSTQWNQDTPFNDLSPVIGTERAVTGCVATALSQVMNYWQWPEDHGTGTATATTAEITNSSGATVYAAQTLTADLSTISLDWDSMLDVYNEGEYTEEQGAAVARLMKAAGYAVHMNYNWSSKGGSGASSAAIAPALKNYFGYAPTAQDYDRMQYPLAQWQQMIYDNLRDVGPIMYAGSDLLEGGHSFVCDGYSSDGYFHFNWGWGGVSDGYFLLTALSPSSQGIGGNSGGFDYQQDAVLGIQKPKDGLVGVDDVPQLTITGTLTGSYGTSLILSADLIYNATGTSYNFDIGLKIVPDNDPSSSPHYATIYSNQQLQPGYGTNQLSASQTALNNLQLSSGTYRVSLVSREYSPQSQWYDALHSFDTEGYVLLTVTTTKKGNKTTYKYVVTNPAQPTLTITNGAINSDWYLNTEGEVTYTISNNSAGEATLHVAPALYYKSTTSGGNSSYTLITEGTAMFFDLMPGETQEVDQIFDWYLMSNQASLNTNYEVWLMNAASDAKIVKIGDAQLHNFEEANLTATMIINNDAGVADKSVVPFEGAVTNPSGYYGDNIEISIFDETGETKVDEFEIDRMFILRAGTTQNYSLVHDFAVGEYGNTYLARMYQKGIVTIEDNDYIAYKTDSPVVQKTFKLADNEPTGVEKVNVSTGIVIRYDRHAQGVTITAPAPLTAVSVTCLDGRRIEADRSSFEGEKASLTLRNAPSGILLVSATDASGHSATVKIVR